MVSHCFSAGCSNFIYNLLRSAGVSAAAIYGTAEVIDHDECSA
jgi:hypothetical protein